MKNELKNTRRLLLDQLALGEDSTRQFKSDIRNIASLASEMAAFANTNGGTIYIGVADDGSTPGLTQKDVSRINQLISNAASQGVYSPLLVESNNIALDSGRIVIILKVPKGIDKPHFDKNGVIWLKTGADKRRLNSKEELRRLFQLSAQLHADGLPTAEIDKLDKLRFRDFLWEVHKLDYPDDVGERTKLLKNINLATDDGRLNLAGVLMFARNPEWIVPQFVVKAIRFPGNEIHATDYMDTEDFSGPLPKIFDGAMSFVMRNLHKVQAGRGVNAPGTPEIPKSVFEELLVNALVHRDYLVSAPIRLFVFDNRIEIISPGHLPNNLTVEKIQAGNSNIRNPILVSYVANGLLPYHGVGSGIKRVLKEWPQIDFVDDHDGVLFTVTVHRTQVERLKLKEIETLVVRQSQSEMLMKTPVKEQPQGKAPVKTLVKEQPQGKTLVKEHAQGKTPVKKLVARRAQSKTLVKEHAQSKTPVKTKPASKPVVASSGRTMNAILELLQEQPTLTLSEVAARIGKSVSAVERAAKKLRKDGMLKYVGPQKGGHWEVRKP